MHLSPTLCRPRHVDSERLRARLGSHHFDRLLYHEAAVVSTAPMQFQLLALTRDTLFIVPLLGRGKAASDMRLPFQLISTIERVVPATKTQRALLLLPTSQLFRLQLREVAYKNAVSELFVSTFEPQTQLLFQLSRAVAIDFQRQLMPHSSFPRSTSEQRLELASLLTTFVIDLVRARDDVQRIELLDELTTAAYASNELKQLFFDDRTQVLGCTGLVAYLARQLSVPLHLKETRVPYLLSIAKVFGAMCFDVNSRTNCFKLLAIDEFISNLLARGVESYTVWDQAATHEQFLDSQIAVLLALDTMQHNETFRLRYYQHAIELIGEKSSSVMLQAIRAPAFSQWLSKVFKKICIAVSRAALAIERLRTSKIEKKEWTGKETKDEEVDDFELRKALEPAEMLATWRYVTVLELLVKSDAALGGKHVCAVLLRTRRDYIDMYLRAPRFLNALRTSKLSHFEDTALKLSRVLKLLQD